MHSLVEFVSCFLFPWISLSGKVSWNNYVLFQIQYQERKVYRLFLCVSVPSGGGGDQLLYVSAWEVGMQDGEGRGVSQTV